MAERKYVRKYLRVRPDVPVQADITIVSVGPDAVRTGKAVVRILDISPGGLRFTSVLNLPVNDSICLELHFRLCGMDLRVKGFITHKRGTEVREYEYGFCFLEPDEALRACLKKLFSSVHVRMEKHIVILRFD